tara:strand:- start:153 stop:3125 length:2973 start_codon:yes stop_codon:yes gene_type:complete
MSKNPFIEFVKVWRKENPNVSYKDALKSAAVDYKKSGKAKSSEPKVKKPKTTEDKEVKNGRAKLIRLFKKLETSINSQITSGKLNEETYDEFRKVGNVLRGNSQKNSYAKKLKDIDRKLKTKKYKSLASKIGKSEQNIQMKISSNKKISSDIQLEELNKEKASAKLRKEERKAKRKRALQQLKNADGTRKYSDNQIDQMLKLEESGLSSKEAKSQTSAIGKYIESDYLKEFRRINPLFTIANAKAYLKRNDSYRKDPYNVPIVSDPEELRNADKAPKPPPLPPAPTATAPVVMFKLSKANSKIRDDLFRDFGVNDSQYNIDNINESIAKDLFFGEMKETFSDRTPLTTQAKITQVQRKVKRVITAYGSQRGATYSRLQDIESLLDDYSNGLIGFKADIKADAKKEKDQVADLLQAIGDTGATITAKTKATADDISTKEANDFLSFIEGTGANVKTEVGKTANDKKIGEFVKAKMSAEVERDKREQKKKEIEAQAIVKREAEKQAKLLIEAEKQSASARAKKIKAHEKAVAKQKKAEEDAIKKLEKANAKSLANEKKKDVEARKVAKAIRQAQAKGTTKPTDLLANTEPKPPPTPKPATPVIDLSLISNEGDGGGGGAKAKPVVPKTITQAEFDSMKKNGGLSRAYTRSYGNLRDNEILDMVETEENGKPTTTIKSTNPNSAGYVSRPPSPKMPQRNRQLLEDELIATEANIRDLKSQLNYGGILKQVLDDYSKALLEGNVDSIAVEVQSVFDDYMGKGANLDSATLQALTQAQSDGDLKAFRSALKNDPVGMNSIDTIAREILANTSTPLYNELDGNEDNLTLLQAEYDGYETPSDSEGEGFAKVKHHLKRAHDYWNSGKMTEHANLVRKHLKSAKKILKMLPKNEVSDKLNSMVDYARSVIDPEEPKKDMKDYAKESKGEGFTNLAQPYSDANTGGNLVRDIRKHLDEIKKSPNDMEKRNAIMKKLHSKLSQLDDKNLHEKLKSTLGEL